MQTEYEIKFLNIDTQRVRTQFQENKGRCVLNRTLMKRIVFNIPNQPHCYIRIRDEGNKITCTYKEYANEQNIEAVQEIHLQVSDFESIKQLLLKTGLTISSYQENFRETRFFEASSVECCIDERPGLPPFLEIEGHDEESVRSLTELLGFNYSEGVFGPVSEIYAKVYETTPDEFNQIPVVTFDHIPRFDK